MKNDQTQTERFLSSLMLATLLLICLTTLTIFFCPRKVYPLRTTSADTRLQKAPLPPPLRFGRFLDALSVWLSDADLMVILDEKDYHHLLISLDLICFWRSRWFWYRWYCLPIWLNSNEIWSVLTISTDLTSTAYSDDCRTWFLYDSLWWLSEMKFLLRPDDDLLTICDWWFLDDLLLF